jgi:ribosomal protein S18 acetylase RimI-like enzyme
MPFTSRPYAGAPDLRRMQQVVADAYTTTTLRVGDVAWISRYSTHHELMARIRLWDDAAGRLIGWSYLRARGGFNVFVASGQAAPGLLDEMLGEIERLAEASVAAGDPPVGLYTYGIDVAHSEEDRALAEALQAGVGGVLTHSLDGLPEPVTPVGYGLGWVETPDQVIGRVEAQRAAFAPSDLLLERYERVRARWPYRPELDRIVVTDAGEVVAFCTAWLDAQNRAGLLEPVGTRPEHQRRGLARAVCLDALHQLRRLGASTAQVGFSTAAARATYESLGFRWMAADPVYRREPAAGTADMSGA